VRAVRLSVVTVCLLSGALGGCGAGDGDHDGDGESGRSTGERGGSAEVGGTEGGAEGTGDRATERCDDDSTILAVDADTTGTDGLVQVHGVTAGGSVDRITGDWVASQPSFAPDRDEIVVVRADGDYESAGPASTALWVVGGDGSAPRALTEGDVHDEDPDWSPDGSSIVFSRAVRAGGGVTRVIATVPADGGEPTMLLSAVDDLQEPAWSPDGDRIAFIRATYLTDSQTLETTVWTMAADGSDTLLVARLPYLESVEWHPDGTSLLVVSGSDGIHLVDLAGGGSRLVGPGAEHPAWSPDGERLYYADGGGTDGQAGRRLRLGHLEDGELVADGEVIEGEGAVAPRYGLAVGPCG
jgi:Tol biopolymer transport system component